MPVCVCQLIEVTGRNQDECMVALHDCNGDVNRAINFLLEEVPVKVSGIRPGLSRHKCLFCNFTRHWVLFQETFEINIILPLILLNELLLQGCYDAFAKRLTRSVGVTMVSIVTMTMQIASLIQYCLPCLVRTPGRRWGRRRVWVKKVQQQRQKSERLTRRAGAAVVQTDAVAELVAPRKVCSTRVGCIYSRVCFYKGMFPYQ